MGAHEGSDAIVIALDDNAQSVRVTRGPETAFMFDRVFPMDTPQHDLYEYSIQDTVKGAFALMAYADVLQGYNGTIFAYGQTGSGKTYTMMGPDIHDAEKRGIVPRLTDQIFEGIMQSPPTVEYLVQVSYMEIYMERIRDLLARA